MDTTGGNLDLLLLAVLRTGPAHGYSIIESLRRRSEGVFSLPESTVYPALHRMEKAGLLGSHWTDESGRRRRVYELTDDGRRALGERRRQWLRFAGGVSAALGQAGP